jgi:prepilin-type N-terminal cleavage/methylation domain-containing protein
MVSQTISEQRGFTLIELLVVIAIIGMLASVVLASLSGARSKARDARRKSDLHNMQIALELYYAKYNTYLVSGAGYDNNGQGWLGYEDGGHYTTAVTRGLYNNGFLGAPRLDDPAQSPGYMIYVCNGDHYSLSATLENPLASDIANIQTTCNGAGANGTYTVYSKNYAIGN